MDILILLVQQVDLHFMKSFLFYFLLNNLQIQTYKYKNFMVFEDKCYQKDFTKWRITYCTYKFRIDSVLAQAWIPSLSLGS